jgi:hypothetical protein
MDYKEFLEYTKLTERLKTFEIWLEWTGFFDYYYWGERYGEGDSIKYADQKIAKKYKLKKDSSNI